MARPAKTDEEFRKHIKRNIIIDNDTGCWIWNGALVPSGYGCSYYEGKSCRAHRLSYLLFVGEIPEDMLVRHKCDNRACVNPEHLEIGTQYDNIHDMINRGRLRPARGERQSKKLKKTDVSRIIELYNSGKIDQYEIAKIYNVNQSTISRVISGKRWNTL